MAKAASTTNHDPYNAPKGQPAKDSYNNGTVTTPVIKDSHGNAITPEIIAAVAQT